jgi:chromosome segregation ATPase
MTKTAVQCGLLIACITVMMLSGCKDDNKKKALAEAAQAKVELVKVKAEMAKLKGEVSYLNEKLQTANQDKDKLQQQLDDLLKERDTVITEADNSLEQTDKLTTVLAEQIRKANELQKQVEQLKAVIRALQSRIEPNKPPEQPKTGGDANQ